MSVQIQLRHDTAANWTSGDPTMAVGEVGIETDTGKFKFGDGSTAWTGLSYVSPAIADILDLPTAEMDDTLVLAPDGAGGVEFRAESGGSATPLNPGIFAEIASPSTPAGGTVAVYAKADGRIYSKDDAGTEFGPFDAAGGGGGGTLYAFDELFPGGSLPAGWAFTGSGTCVVSGGVATVTGAAQSDRLMFAYTPTRDIQVIRAHLQNLTGEGGMPSLVVMDSAGKGIGTGPYNDGNWYAWTANGTAYQYSGTNVLVAASPSFPGITDVWLSLLVIDGHVVGAGFSTDGINWTALNVLLVTQITVSQVGIVQLFSSANSNYGLAELTITEP